jgi:hypothetical protein
LREASHEEMSNDPAPTRQNQNEETINTRWTRHANASREPLWKWLGMKRSNVGQVASMRVSLNKLKVVTICAQTRRDLLTTKRAAGRASTSCLNSRSNRSNLFGTLRTRRGDLSGLERAGFFRQYSVLQRSKRVFEGPLFPPTPGSNAAPSEECSPTGHFARSRRGG